MKDVGDRKLRVAVAVSFASGFFLGWQACRMWRRFLGWRKRRLQKQLQETQRRLDMY
ncbi:mitoregulin [Macrotis lagotis]|uniref:mitoregulin n=1 Tax=Macrotis lagotis TaxID=92651 RepID=UPI003D69529B